MELTAPELAQQIGAPLEQVCDWRSRGLIGQEGVESFGPHDVQRGRVIQLLLRRGMALSAIARAEEEEAFLGPHAELMFPGDVGRVYTMAEAAERVGLAAEAVRRFWDAAGLAEQGELLYEQDVEAFSAIRVALDAGLPEEALLQVVRVYADTLGRVAENESRLFHFYVHERLKAQGLRGREFIEVLRASSDRVSPLVEPVILYFHRKAQERAMRDDAVLHVRDRNRPGEKAEVEAPGHLRVAIAFVDLSGFTSLADVMGDDLAARVLGRFSQLVREAAGRCDGRVVKQIGDAFMLVFSEPRSAVVCALEIERRSGAERQFPAVRTGIHYGDVLYREGDYLGTGVNTAARLVAEAGPHQILMTTAARQEGGSVPGVRFVPLGKRRLRGLTEEAEVFQVVGAAASGTALRAIDPVCGMELASGEALAKLSFHGQEMVFCSQRCLQRFADAPERYSGSAGAR